MYTLYRSILAGAMLVVVASFLTYSGAARATLWQNGDFITYNQSGWGSGVGGGILLNNYGTVYAPSFIFQIGLTPNFYAQWTDPTILVLYLPASGAPGTLDANS